MKKILIGCIVLMAMVLVGCSATDKAYGVAKAGYKVGEAVVDVTGYESEKLSKVHKVASSYDEARTVVRDTDEKKLDADTSPVSEN
ncbi:MAG: hypothetical protein COB61_011510 [Thiotrichales bacterium]|nr:hypothetical protein [Thiotrichales bacterium]